jgi:Mrp family chromosome partitioning ATPase
MAFAACVGMGLALAFLLDFVIDRTIKRSVEVSRHLRVPLLISIPDTHWNGRVRLSSRRHHRSGRRHSGARHGESAANGNGALVRWDSRNSIQLYANGLRERLITYFEGTGAKHGRPKRVALTSCSPGSGVTTIANSLAAALSKIPNVKVLLVDMNIGNGVARTFRNGEACTTTQDAPQTEDHVSSNDEPGDSENLAVVQMRNGANGHSTEGLPAGLAHLAPQFEANDHDFIIFDLPPASPTSMTPRLAGYMDIVLLVLESEKTGRETAKHASDLMKDSRANVAAVLNKYRKYVPERLVPEF